MKQFLKTSATKQSLRCLMLIMCSLLFLQYKDMCQLEDLLSETSLTLKQQSLRYNTMIQQYYNPQYFIKHISSSLQRSANKIKDNHITHYVFKDNSQMDMLNILNRLELYYGPYTNITFDFETKLFTFSITTAPSAL